MLKYETNINEKKYWKKTIIKEKDLNNEEFNIIKVYPDIKVQAFLGFGGALTEASAINYNKLSGLKKKEFITAYYSRDGLDYSWGRVSIGSNDFCLNSYENDDFSHEKVYIIPFIKDILKVKDLIILASPWSPPSRMKDNNSLCNGGKLLKEYYKDYADYLLNFIKTFKENGINIKYLTMQNEPMAKQSWESCCFTIDEQKDFIYNYLLPKLDNISLFLWDHNKEDLYNIVNNLYEENDQVKGIAYHWYTGNHSTNLKLIHEKYPNLLLMHSEGCCGFSNYNEKEWVHDAEILLIDLISDLNNGMSVYLDWNILLDYQGGPNHQNNFCKSPIILSKDEKSFIKTPIYYYFGHISKFIKEGDIINPISLYDNSLYGISATNDLKTSIIILNPSDENKEINLVIKDKVIKDIIKSHSIVTYIFEN